MTVAVVMPLYGEARMEPASWVRRRFARLHPDWPFHVGTDGGEVWTKARAVNRGVARVDPDVVVITDADVAVPAVTLVAAVQAVIGGAAWAVPYSMVYRLDRDHTDRIIQHAVDVDVTPMPDGCVPHRPPYHAVPGGGILVVGRAAWAKVGGFDERFVWGQEDAPLGHALDTLVGRHAVFDGPLWHFWHVPRSGLNPQMYADQHLEARYLTARGQPEAMRRLIAERSRTLDPCVQAG